MSHVFLSYNHEDHHHADMVSFQLEKEGLVIWQDSHDLRGGDLWADEIDKAISSALAVVVILTPDSEASPYVTYEWSFAMGKDKLVIPLMFKKCGLIHPKLESRQYLDFSTRNSKPWSKLTQQLHDEIGRLENIAESDHLVSPTPEKQEPVLIPERTNNSPLIELPSIQIAKSIPEWIEVNGQKIKVPVFSDWTQGDYGYDQYGYWAALNFKGTRQLLRWIPPGQARLGSPEDELGRRHDETLYQVHFQEGFWLADFPVTQLLYQVVMGENPSKFQQTGLQDLPVERVSWLYAQAFMVKLNRNVPGLDVYLPLESQWEYACRAGSETAFWFGDQINLTQGNYAGVWSGAGFSEQALRSTNGYQQYPANLWGLYDMHGNVWEWCLDPWQKDQKKGIQSISPAPLAKQTQQQALSRSEQDKIQAFTLRGGCWFNGGQRCQSAYRDWSLADDRNGGIGFRFSRSADQ